MKTKIMTIVLILILILTIFIMWKGIKISNIELLSINELNNKNEELNGKILKASELTSVEYENSKKELENTYEKYKVKKQEYEEISGFSDEREEELYETKQYDIAYLWKTLGKYATSRNLTLGINVQKNTGTNLYNLNFTVKGQYVNISEFISDIENDSNLYFRIYNFKMSGNGQIISSTFTVKDINIDPSTITTNTSLK